MLKKLRGNKKGFSLMEVIFYMVLVGILIGIAVPNLGKFKEKAELTKIQADVKTIETMAAFDFAEKTPAELAELIKADAPAEGLWDKNLNKVEGTKVAKLDSVIGEGYDEFIKDSGTEFKVAADGDFELYITKDGKVVFAPQGAVKEFKKLSK